MRRMLFLSLFAISLSQPATAETWQDFKQKSADDKKTFITQALEKKYPDYDKNRITTLTPKVIDCLIKAADAIPFETSTDVCLEIAAEDVK